MGRKLEGDYRSEQTPPLEYFKPWAEMQDSCLCRRGRNMACSSEVFRDVVHSIETVFLALEKPLRLLFIGVAQGQEALSVLAVLNSLCRKDGISLNESVELQVVDLREPLTEKDLQVKEAQFILKENFPGYDFVQDSFTRYDHIYAAVKPEIQEVFLAQLSSSHQPQYWHTDVRDYVMNEPEEPQSLIFYNNTHGHIPESKRKEDIIPALLRRLVLNGVLVTDNAEYDDPVERHPLYQELKEELGIIKLFPGIYQRTIV